MEIHFVKDAGVPEDAPEAVVELVNTIVTAVDGWWEKSEKPARFKHAVIMTSLTSILAMTAAEAEVPVEVVLMNLLNAVQLNQGTYDSEDQTVH